MLAPSRSRSPRYWYLPGAVSHTTAIDCDVSIAVTSELPGSQRVVWPTNPWPSVPVIPARAAALVVDVLVGDPDVVVTVFVVVLADGGTASGVGRGGPVSSPLEISNDASTAATANSTITAPASAICGLPRRLLRGAGSAGGGAGYGVYPVPAGFS